MTLSTALKTNRLDETSVATLARKSGPCWTALLPATHPGSGDGDKLVTLRSLAHAMGATPDTDWLQRMEISLLGRELMKGGPGVALFATTDSVEAFQADVEVAQIAGGQYAYVLPLLREVETLQEFLILGLSKKQLRLIRFDHGTCHELELPEGMPTRIEETHDVMERDGIIENHAASGGGLGNMTAVRFGSEPERESANIHLEHFLAQVEEALRPTAGTQKVLLLGVAEEVAAFRRIAKSVHLFEGQLAVGMRDLTLGEIAQMGAACAQAEQVMRGKIALERIREFPNRTLILEGLRQIAEAAGQGRVDTFCIGEGDRAMGIVGERNELANTVAVETLRHGGKVFVLPKDAMRGFENGVALLRY